MKYLLFLPLALLLGLVIGAWAPNEELRVVRKELSELSKRQARSDRSMRFDAITRMVHIPDRASEKPRTNRAERVVANTNAVDSGSVDGTNQAVLVEAEATREQRRFAPEDLQARIEEAKDLWATRVQIAREQWLNRLKIAPEQVAQFDSAIDAMNGELLAYVQNIADMLAADESMTPELGARLINEMSASAVRTYDDLEAIVPVEQRGELAQMDMSDFIDPAVAEPLIDVQDKFENLRPSSSGTERPRVCRRRR